MPREFAECQELWVTPSEAGAAGGKGEAMTGRVELSLESLGPRVSARSQRHHRSPPARGEGPGPLPSLLWAEAPSEEHRSGRRREVTATSSGYGCHAVLPTDDGCYPLWVLLFTKKR